jgi:energy-coupling factor transport system permease protein
MIELSRNITFGQYINNGSALTRMDPRTKLLCAILLITLVSIVSSVTAFAICLLFCAVLQRTSRISTGYVLGGFRIFIGFFIFIFVLQVLFYQAPPHTPVLWQWSWQWWIVSIPLTITWKGIIVSALTIVRVLFLYYLTSMLLFTTSLVDLTDGLEALLSPLQKIGIPANAFIMVLVIAFKFVPIFVTEIERLVKAQAARGVRFDQGNFIQRTLKLAPLMIPLFVSGFKRAETLSIAMEARCYGTHRGWRRSKRRALTFTRFDALVLVFTVVVCIVAILVNIFAPF